MWCHWPALTKGTPCDECGFELWRDFDKPPRRICKAAPKLGDRVERILSSIGVTQDRVSAVLELFGAPPGCGGCEERKKYLNRVSEWWRGEG